MAAHNGMTESGDDPETIQNNWFSSLLGDGSEEVCPLMTPLTSTCFPEVQIASNKLQERVMSSVH